MFIAKVKTGHSRDGLPYFTYKLLTTQKVGALGRTQQRIVLNLGARYSFPKEHWKSLCQRVEEILVGFTPLFLPEQSIEQEAKRLVHLIQLKECFSGEVDSNKTSLNGYYLEDMDYVEPRTVGLENISMHALNELQIDKIFSEVGFNQHQSNLSKALIIGRMIHPASELSTYYWLQKFSALGEILGEDFNFLSHMSLYRACDNLLAKKDEIETKLFDNILYDKSRGDTICLYDITNTYLEGQPKNNKAKYGLSKEKRSDCLLVSLAIIIDGSGFIRKSIILPGNISEQSTLENMIEKLNPAPNTLFVMDRGIATSKNVTFLKENGYRYLVMNRDTKREFDVNLGKPLINAGGNEILIYSQMNEDNTELKLMCRSEKRADKEIAMLEKRMKKFEERMTLLCDSLKRPRARRDLDTVSRAIGKITQEFAGVSQYYKIEVQDNRFTKKLHEPFKVIHIRYERKDTSGTKLAHPGVYSLKTNDLTLSPESMWQKYIELTRVESVFRSLKSELGLRPIYHRKEERIDSHIFVSILAFQGVHMIRHLLSKENIHDSWTTLRETLSTHVRVTARVKSKVKGTIEYRKTTIPEEHQLRIYNALRLNPMSPKVTKKLQKDTD
ncbi:MAG: IS1634 family transposase [Clostridiales Family XIII bacterium]|jgi:hypothetical protein|nr:IS1634 family transposase [Clostridiales Family XIII bacterium]